MFSFQPMTEEECLELLKKGYYDYIVRKAMLGVSKSSGRQMMTLTIGIFDEKGREKTVTDYLATPLKIRQFAYSNGLESKYEAGGFLTDECINRVGKCSVDIDEPEPGSPYSPKNVIKKYLKRSTEEQKSIPSIDPKLNDDLPF